MNIKTFTYIFIIISSVNIFSQKIKLDNNFDIEIRKIKFTKTTNFFIIMGGDKYLVFDISVYSNFDKKVKFPLYKLKLETETKKYISQWQHNMAPIDPEERCFKIKKKKKTRIYIVVKKNFKKGNLYFGEKYLGKLSTLKGTKKVKLELKKSKPTPYKT